MQKGLAPEGAGPFAFQGDDSEWDRRRDAALGRPHCLALPCHVIFAV